MKKLYFLFLLMVSFASSAMWLTKIEDSIFDEKTALLLGEVNNGTSFIIIECKGDDLYFSFVERANTADFKPYPVTLLFKIDGNPTLEFNATTSQRNVDHIQATSQDVTNILSVIDELRTAKNKFMVGLTVKGTDYRASFTGDVYRSTAEVNKFIKACDIKYQF